MIEKTHCSILAWIVNCKCSLSVWIVRCRYNQKQLSKSLFIYPLKQVLKSRFTRQTNFGVVLVMEDICDSFGKTLLWVDAYLSTHAFKYLWDLRSKLEFIVSAAKKFYKLSCSFRWIVLTELTDVHLSDISNSYNVTTFFSLSLNRYISFSQLQ